MGVIAVFDYAKWLARYPEFASVSQPTAQEYFDEAGIYWRNDGTGLTADPVTQLRLLNMLTAHIAARYSQSQGSPSPGSPQDANSPVGRISTASEGSVSVSTENSFPAGSPQWFQTTKYGSDFWNAAKSFASMRYRANPGGPYFTGLYGGGPYGRGY